MSKSAPDTVTVGSEGCVAGEVEVSGLATTLMLTIKDCKPRGPDGPRPGHVHQVPVPGETITSRWRRMKLADSSR